MVAVLAGDRFLVPVFHLGVAHSWSHYGVSGVCHSGQDTGKQTP